MADPQGVAPDAAVHSTGRARGSWAATARLVQLHLLSRRTPAALVITVVCGALFQATLRWQRDAHSLQVPLIIEAAAAAIVGVATHSPFGESERAAGTSLPYLRLGVALGLTATSFASLLAGAAGADLFGGTTALLRNVFGIAGVGLISATIIGGSLSWIGPLAYLAVTEEALSAGWRTPWMWPAKRPRRGNRRGTRLWHRPRGRLSSGTARH